VDRRAFEAEYQKVFDRAFSGDLDDLAFAVEIERLWALARTVDDDDDRRMAGNDVAGLESALKYGGGSLSEAESAAAVALARAGDTAGSPADRIARAEAGMNEIARIADQARTYEEKQAILEMNESLAMLVSSLRGGADG
jgi:hypothetical protein